MITPFDIDVQAFLSLNGDGGWFADRIMWIASAKLTWVPLYAVVLWWIWRERGWKVALTFLIAAAIFVLLADQTATFCKNHLSKFRPTHYPPLEGLVHTVNGYLGGPYGTVSSHAANSVGFALLASLLIRRSWVTVTLAAWVLFVSYSRIYLGVHYPLDILFGLVDGLFWSTLVYCVLQKFVLKRLK